MGVNTFARHHNYFVLHRKIFYLFPQQKKKARMCLQKYFCDPCCMLTPLQTLQAEVRKKCCISKNMTLLGEANQMRLCELGPQVS